ncbi:MAG: CBS domain-containing protein [Gammaproteobacteria bacterium]|nr:CBS domain-containing protein [Gammaproteobacteria bacterium]MDH5304255.1 CBS domain-containing protein [Gammaproteobacteria bacterium]MDH5321448.1 CBS domain-containing protein [Gammaproteobacteria bacterium]
MPLRSVLVKDYMSGKLVTFTPEMDVLDAIHELIQHRIAGAPVVDDHGNLVGMLSEFDCMKVVLAAAYHHEPGGPVSDLMVSDVKTVDAGMSVIDLAELFMESGLRRYPVMKDNRLVGQISRRDVLRALAEISQP